MIVYLLFIRGTLYGAFKTVDAAHEYVETLTDEEDKRDAWIVPEDVRE
jgi:hypothetical protein